MKLRDKQNGFSLIELVVAIAIGAIAGAMIMLIATNGLKNIKNTKRMERLHANAILISDTMTNLVKQADVVIVSGGGTILDLHFPNSSTTTLTRLPLTSCSPTVNGIIIKGNVITSCDVDVTQFDFTEFANSIHAVVTLEYQHALPTCHPVTPVQPCVYPETLNYQITVAYRNEPI